MIEESPYPLRSMNDYRRSLTPYPYVAGKNSDFLYRSSKWLAKGLDLIFWIEVSLFVILAIALFSTNLFWALTFLISAVLICPLVPIHFAAKLVLSVFAVLPPSIASPMAVALGGLWLIAALRGPATNDSDV